MIEAVAVLLFFIVAGTLWGIVELLNIGKIFQETVKTDKSPLLKRTE